MVLLMIIGIIIFLQMNFVLQQQKKAPYSLTKVFVDILPVLMTSTVAYSFLLLAIVICTIELKSRQLLHSTYKLFVFSVVLQFFGILLQAMAFLKYAINGVGIPRLRTTGRISIDYTV